MSRLYFIFVLILVFIFQCIKGQGRFAGRVSDIDDEGSDVSKNCIGTENYCCQYAAANSYPEENYELLVNNPISSNAHVFFGPVLIIISLLVLRFLSRKAEE